MTSRVHRRAAVAVVIAALAAPAHARASSYDALADAVPAEATATAAPTTPAGQTPGPGGTPMPTAPAADGAVTDAASRRAERTDSGTPVPLVVLAVLAVLLALAALTVAALRLLAWDPRRAAATRHAVAEAGWRASATWADLSDWARSRGTPSPR